MTNYAPYLLADGRPTQVDLDNVYAFEPVPLPGSTGTGLWPIGVWSGPLVLQVDPVTFAGTLTGLGKQLALLTQASGEPLGIVVGNGAPEAQVIVGDVPSVPTLSTLCGVDGAVLWTVQGDPATIAAQLTPPPGPPFTFPGQAFAGAIVLGNGTIPPGGSFGPISAGPYILGSGDYTFSLGAAPYPPLLAQVTQLQNPPLDIVLGADPVGLPGYCNVQGRVIGGGPWGDWAFMLILFRLN